MVADDVLGVTASLVGRAVCLRLGQDAKCWIAVIPPGVIDREDGGLAEAPETTQNGPEAP